MSGKDYFDILYAYLYGGRWCTDLRLTGTCHYSNRSKFDLLPDTTYQRLLVHRCAAYYKLAPENEPLTRGISVCITAESRLYVFYFHSHLFHAKCF